MEYISPPVMTADPKWYLLDYNCSFVRLHFFSGGGERKTERFYWHWRWLNLLKNGCEYVYWEGVVCKEAYTYMYMYMYVYNVMQRSEWLHVWLVCKSWLCKHRVCCVCPSVRHIQATWLHYAYTICVNKKSSLMISIWLTSKRWHFLRSCTWLFLWVWPPSLHWCWGAWGPVPQPSEHSTHSWREPWAQSSREGKKYDHRVHVNSFYSSSPLNKVMQSGKMHNYASNS